MRKYFDRLQSHFLRAFGNLKFFPWPLFLIYDPKGYQVRGFEVREVMKQLQPGDILLRGYDKYLSGVFIPGYFSHAGLYMGAVTEADCQLCSPELTTNKSGTHFRTGEQMVVHAMAQGVFMEDIIDFCRCDRLLVVRFPQEIRQQTRSDKVEADDRVFSIEEYNLFRDLRAGKTIDFSAVWPMIRRVAFSHVGKPYDYKFNFDNYNDLSCTEYVQSCIKALAPFHGIEAIEKHYFGIFRKSVIEPDEYYRTCFDVVWRSRSVDLGKVAQRQH